MADPATQALPAATPATDPVSDYYAQVQAAMQAPREGYVDPHFTDSPRDPDAEVLGTARDDLGEPVETTTPTEQAPAAPQEQAQQQEEQVVEQVVPPADPDAPLPAQDEPQQQPQEGDKPPQFRLRPAKGDKLGEQALWFMRRNPDMPLETAMAKARAQLGIEEPAVSTATPNQETTTTTEQATPPTVVSLEELESTRVDLLAKLRTARESLDYDEQATIQAQLDDLVYDAIPKAREATARSAQVQQTQTLTALQQSAQTAASLYPEATQEGSEFFNRMIEIEHALTATGDPLINDPNKPLVIAQMAARELNIAPQRKGTAQPPTAAPSQQPRPAARVQMTAPLASPGARVTTAPVPAIEQAIEKVSSAEDYEALMSQLVGKRR
ncbi:MAG: hypothetical protein IPM06_18355 [Rhizobiales bacterium]|nr:hypothetical protein [Hyphomicrobiales bacterium]